MLYFVTIFCESGDDVCYHFCKGYGIYFTQNWSVAKFLFEKANKSCQFDFQNMYKSCRTCREIIRHPNDLGCLFESKSDSMKCHGYTHRVYAGYVNGKGRLEYTNSDDLDDDDSYTFEENTNRSDRYKFPSYEPIYEGPIDNLYILKQKIPRVVRKEKLKDTDEYVKLSEGVFIFQMKTQITEAVERLKDKEMN